MKELHFGVGASQWYGIEIRRWSKSGKVGKWWHLPIVRLHRLLWSRYVLCIPDGRGGGDLYTDRVLTKSVIVHEAVHCRQAHRRMLRFALEYLLIPGARLEFECEAYTEGLLYLSQSATREEAAAAVTFQDLVDRVKPLRMAYLWLRLSDARMRAGYEASMARLELGYSYRVLLFEEGES